jgi:hypothetical protein
MELPAAAGISLLLNPSKIFQLDSDPRINILPLNNFMNIWQKNINAPVFM